MASNAPIGFRLRQLRKRQGWTLKEISAQTKISVPYLSAVENGKRNPGFKTIEKYAKACFGDSRHYHSRLRSLLGAAAQQTMDDQGVSDARKISGVYETLSLFEKDIFEGIRILRGGTLDEAAYEMVSQEGFEIREEGTRLARKSIVKVDGESFEVEISLSKVQPIIPDDQE